MKDKFTTHFVILMLVLSLDCKVLFAQDVSPASRENLIFATLDYLQEKQKANNREKLINEAIKESEKKISKGEIEKKEKVFSFDNLVSHTHPYLTIETKFDDNVDSTKLKKSSMINKFTPGLKMNFRDGSKYLALDVHIDNELYNNRRRSNSQNLDTQILTAFNIERYILTIFDDYFNNYVSGKEFGVDNSKVENYWSNTFSSILGRSFNRLGFDLGYKRTDYDYESAFSNNDRTEEDFTFNPYLRISKKTRALLEYTHKRIKYTHNQPPPDDSNSDDFNLSLSSVLSPKLTGLAKIGYKLSDNKVSDNARDTTLKGDIGYKISKHSDLALSLKHVIHEPATKSSYSIENGFKLTGNHRLAFNPKFNLFLSYELDDFDYSKNIGFTGKTHRYTWSTELTYAFRQWLDFSLKYDNTKNISNVSTEYSKDVITFKTQARF